MVSPRALPWAFMFCPFGALQNDQSLLIFHVRAGSQRKSRKPGALESWFAMICFQCSMQKLTERFIDLVAQEFAPVGNPPK